MSDTAVISGLISLLILTISGFGGLGYRVAKSYISEKTQQRKEDEHRYNEEKKLNNEEKKLRELQYKMFMEEFGAIKKRQIKAEEKAEKAHNDINNRLGHCEINIDKITDCLTKNGKL